MTIGDTVIYQPLITEKSMVAAGRGWYSFKVHADADKRSVVRDIKRLYNVDAVTVRTMTRKGKMHRSGRKMLLSRKTDWKKAVIRLKSGQRIAVFEVTDSAAKT